MEDGSDGGAGEAVKKLACSHNVPGDLTGNLALKASCYTDTAPAFGIEAQLNEKNYNLFSHFSIEDRNGIQK